MQEKEIIKSERYDVKKLAIIICVVGVLLLAIYLVFDASRYAPRFNELSAKGYDWFDYKSPLDMAFKQDGGIIVAFLIPVVFAIVAFLIYRSYSKVELVITNKRVYGTAKLGKRVDLPLDSISAVGTSIMSGIDVATSSGAIKFKFIKNRDEVHKEISNLLVQRQEKETKPTTTIKQEIQQSSADELAKFKDLLDKGIITQEEFDAKKKQLLGL